MPQNSGRSSAGIIVLVVGLVLLVPCALAVLGAVGALFYLGSSGASPAPPPPPMMPAVEVAPDVEPALTEPEPAPIATSMLVTVVGDETASVVIDELAKHGIQTVSTLDRQSDSSLIVVVQDSTVGPQPIHLDIAMSLQKRPAVDYLWVFTNTSMVDDQELLELEELECRELFNSQGLPGDEVMFGFDSSGALVSSDYDCPKGWNAIVRHITRVSP